MSSFDSLFLKKGANRGVSPKYFQQCMSTCWGMNISIGFVEILMLKGFISITFPFSECETNEKTLFGST